MQFLKHQRCTCGVTIARYSRTVNQGAGSLTLLPADSPSLSLGDGEGAGGEDGSELHDQHGVAEAEEAVAEA